MSDQRGKLIQSECDKIRAELPNAHVLVAVYEAGFINFSHSLDKGGVVAWLRAMADLIEKGKAATVEDVLKVERSVR